MLDWINFGECDKYDTSALYQTYKICNSCFELIKIVKKLRERELQMAWRLGILENPESLETIPEGKY